MRLRQRVTKFLVWWRFAAFAFWGTTWGVVLAVCIVMHAVLTVREAGLVSLWHLVIAFLSGTLFAAFLAPIVGSRKRPIPFWPYLGTVVLYVGVVITFAGFLGSCLRAKNDTVPLSLAEPLLLWEPFAIVCAYLRRDLGPLEVSGPFMSGVTGYVAMGATFDQFIEWCGSEGLMVNVSEPIADIEIMRWRTVSPYRIGAFESNGVLHLLTGTQYALPTLFQDISLPMRLSRSLDCVVAQSASLSDGRVRFSVAESGVRIEMFCGDTDSPKRSAFGVVLSLLRLGEKPSPLKVKSIAKAFQPFGFDIERDQWAFGPFFTLTLQEHIHGRVDGDSETEGHS